MTGVEAMIDKRVFLEKSAYEVFSEKGYKHTNISEIAKRAEMATGSFYKYYQSKEDLFLVIYIKENDRVRNHIIEKIDWNSEPIDVVEQLFTRVLECCFNNKILSEWNNPAISNVLHKHYYSEEGKGNYTFHKFLINIFQERLAQEKYDTELINKLVKVYDLFYYIDCHISNKDFENYEETLQLLVKYFMKGVFS